MDKYEYELELAIQSSSLDVRGESSGHQDESDEGVSSYVESADGFVVVYDCTCRESFDSARAILEHMFDALRAKHRASDPNGHTHFNPPPVVLAGNKYDLSEELVVTIEEGQELMQSFLKRNTLPCETRQSHDPMSSSSMMAQQRRIEESRRNYLFFETSAVDMMNIGTMFAELAASIVEYRTHILADQLGLSFAGTGSNRLSRRKSFRGSISGNAGRRKSISLTNLLSNMQVADNTSNSVSTANQLERRRSLFGGFLQQTPPSTPITPTEGCNTQKTTSRKSSRRKSIMGFFGLQKRGSKD